MQSVFTDCPHREKLGWLEQVHLNGPGLLYNYDLAAYGPQIMQNMADAQHPDRLCRLLPRIRIFEGPGLNPLPVSRMGEHWSFSRLCITKPMEMIL